MSARVNYETTCAAVFLGEAGEADAAALEREIEALDREVRRCQAAVRELERRLGVIRDPGGVILR